MLFLTGTASPKQQVPSARTIRTINPYSPVVLNRTTSGADGSQYSVLLGGHKV